MTERALASAPTGVHGGDSDAEPVAGPRQERPADQERLIGPGLPGNPAIRLLDALRHGDDDALLAEVGQSTTFAADNMPWACRGPDEVQTALREARERFPGLSFESHTRHVGFGLVIEEARVRDESAELRERTDVEAETQPVIEASPDLDTDPAHVELDAVADEPGKTLAPYDDEVAASDPEPDPSHPMWDNLGPGHRIAALALWEERPALDRGPIPLDLPVRLTVRHDDLQVHEVTVSFPAVLLQRALGHQVDPREVALSEVQAAFIAPPGSGFTTHELESPALSALSVTSPEVALPTEPETAAETTQVRRRRRWIPAMIVALVVVATAGWWFVQGGRDSSTAGAASASSSPAPAPDVADGVTTAVDAAATSAQPPRVTRVHSAPVPHRTPTLVLKSDLAFGFDSSSLSPRAKNAIDAVARQVQRAGLDGTIYVDGYTDDLGSAAHGAVLSQRRADAVSTYLQSRLLGAPVTIVSAGHGEANPVASNATAAGRKQNRRVTITLPHA